KIMKFQNIMERTSSDIKIDLSLDKQSYLENESIILHIKVKNNSNETDSIKNLIPYRISNSILLKNNKGEMLPYSSLIMDITTTYTLIQPNKELNFDINLIESNGSKKLESADILRRNFLPGGSYSVGLLMDKNTYGRELSSNIISFEIKEPTGQEKLDLDNLKQIYKIKDGIERSLQYRDFAFNNIQSNYMETAFMSYDMIRIFDNKKEHTKTLIEDYKNFIEIKPNAIQIGLILLHCYHLIESDYSKTDASDFLKTVIINHTNDKAGSEAEALLEKL